MTPWCKWKLVAWLDKRSGVLETPSATASSSHERDAKVCWPSTLKRLSKALSCNFVESAIRMAAVVKTCHNKRAADGRISGQLCGARRVMSIKSPHVSQVVLSTTRCGYSCESDTLM